MAVLPMLNDTPLSLSYTRWFVPPLPDPISPLHPSPLITALAFCVCESASFSCDIHSCIFRFHVQAVPCSIRPPLHYFHLSTMDGNILFFSWLSSAPLCEPVWSHFLYPFICRWVLRLLLYLGNCK